LCLDLLGDHDRLLVLDWCHLLLPQRLLGAFIVPQIELCADKDDRYAGCVMVDLGVPLYSLSTCETRARWILTFAFTLSNDGGLTMEKQIKKTSVCGYESGRNRS
jgi:hypothetical protein